LEPLGIGCFLTPKNTQKLKIELEDPVLHSPTWKKNMKFIEILPLVKKQMLLGNKGGKQDCRIQSMEWLKTVAKSEFLYL